jgi:response regulator RpfG family c-di-GMP phosphodiesterase
MIHSTMRVNLLDLIKCISEALRLLSPDMAEHHNQAAYISYKLCEALQWRENETIKTTLAASLHDIGAISLEEKMEDLRFEDSSIYNHAQLGYLLLDKFTPFQELAPLVRYHHQPWVAEKDGKENLAPQGSYLIHLADRVAVSIDNQKHILQQRDDICTHISSQKHVYNPEHVEAFLQIAQKESFWLDIVSPSLNEV